MKTGPTPGTRVRFGTFEANLRSGELRRDGLKVKIQELPFQVLVLLLERPGEVVTREHLRSRLWPADTFVDFEQGLNKAVNKLREALRDDANNPRFVETLTRRGYRFIAPVDAGTSSRQPGPNIESASGNKGPTSSKRRILLAIAGLLLMIAVVALVVWWRGARSEPAAPSWSGEILPGPNISSFPSVSPDGHRVAFVAMEDNIAQVAVMDPGSGNWRLLTHDRTHGATIGVPSWSRDGSTIYFDRIISQPAGVYSVPALGGEERLVLADAASPQTLPDNSLLVVRVDSDRRYQIYHYWPATGRLQALGAWVGSFWVAPVRVLPGGSEAVFVGYLKGGENNPHHHLFLMHIATDKTQPIPLTLSKGPTSLSRPLAVTPDGQSILLDLPSNNLHRIVAIPRSGKGPIRTLLTLSSMPMSLDAAPDGSLYVDQVDRPMQVLRFTPSGGVPEVLASIDSWIPRPTAPPVEFPDGRILIPAIISGRPRLLLSSPGGNPFPLLTTNEEAAYPARIGDDQVALIAGNSRTWALAIASVKEGRIIRRFKVTKGKPISEVAASPDGKSLYYVSSGNIWSIPSQGGSPRKICAGDGVAVDANGRELIVKLNEKEHVLLERVPLPGGKAQAIQVRSNLLIAPYTLAPNALNNDGKLLVIVAPKDSWFYGVAILDIATGKLTPVPLNSNCDIDMAGWTSDGRILATGSPLRSNIWRFRPAR